ncbi:MAG: ATP-binding cassette domain-containing protein [Lunatimonas sp.]|uniref:ABC transporter ATP-binding protein n=1 Tax=Lunatimonas sp. TaxID=2060141 RepID=UPI00263AFAA0|nr:ATP-binding cassette domain-containing protein [Lunatimonas sp.]MCC5938573.1 ATP-binding cassette domain-containing protein [Lunatimonas sp.]
MILKATQLAFAYNDTTRFELPDIELGPGEELLVLGQSGSGKTTLLNILGGLLKPQKGEVTINGKSLYRLEGNSLDKFRGKHIGIVFQKPHLLTALSVVENLQVANYFVGKDRSDLIEKNLEELGILDKKKAKVTTLSEGEAQRVSIARALANEPLVILADEPTASLDDTNAEAVIRLLKAQAKRLGAALIVVTHDQRVKNHISNHLTIGKA